MNSRVVIVHGWMGSPEANWLPWLRQELEQRGFAVVAPELPDTEEPRIDAWVPALASAVGELDSDTYFVGHSMGCQAIARYVAGLPDDTAAGGALFVAGFFTELTGLEDDEDWAIGDAWLEAPLDLATVKQRLPKSIALFSDDDPFVPLSNQEAFRDELGSKIVTESGRGHFDDAQEPSVLAATLELLGVS